MSGHVYRHVWLSPWGGGASREERSRVRPDYPPVHGTVSLTAKKDSVPNVSRAKVMKAGSVKNKGLGERKMTPPPAHNCFSF